jgi:hypothetical protein
VSTLNDGGPAFPQPETAYPKTKVNGMTLRDWFAGQETLSDLDDPEAIVSDEMAEGLAGPKPKAGWTPGNIVAMTRWEAKWRAALRYLRADAMIAEREKGRS